MGYISSINNKWRLCKIASASTLLILVFFLRRGSQDVDNYVPSALARTTVVSASSSANDTDQQLLATNMQLMRQPSNLVVQEKKTKEENCNFYRGKWVYDPKASPMYHGKQCPFLSDQVSCQRNGRPDADYENWTWEADGCEIPRFDGRDMLERLRGKRVIIVGDSLNRNQWESLACLLYSSLSPSEATVDVRSGSYKVFRAKNYNCIVEFHWSPFLVQLDINIKENGARMLKLEQISSLARKWRGADVMVFNTGHWWVQSTKFRAWDMFQYDGKSVEEMEIESAFKIGMKTWADWVDRNVDPSKTIVFFRSISPQHKGNQLCYNETQPLTDESYEERFPKPMVEIVEQTISNMKTPVRYLNVTKLSQYRRDAHPSIYAKEQGKFLISLLQGQPDSVSDCSHWCLPGLPDTWNRLLFASLVNEHTPKDVLGS